MTKPKKIILFVVSVLIYFIAFPELIFNHLSDAQYHFFAKLTNPFGVFGSTANSLIAVIIVLPVLLAWLTVVVVDKVMAGRRG